MVADPEPATASDIRESVIMIDSTGVIRRFDGGAERTFGYSAAEVIGENVCRLMPEPHRSEHDRYLAEYRRTGDSHIIGVGRSVTAIRKDGSGFPAHLSITEIEIDGAQMFVGILRDMTAQIAADDKSRATELALEAVSKSMVEQTRLRRGAEEREFLNRQRFEAVVENAPSAISVRDLGHQYMLVNEAFCRLFGQKSVGDVIGRTEDEILPLDVLKRSRRGEARLRAGENFVEEESIGHGPDILSVLTQRFPLRDSAGAISEFVTIRTDITLRREIERRAAERTLWESRIGEAIDEGRLLVYSQPIVDIATRETVTEELMVRLRLAGSKTILTPDEFLPQCEQHGLIGVIDRYMVRRAIDLARAGRSVSVNITGQTIGDPTAMSEILQALTNAGRELTDKIDFELTETTALGSPDVARKFSVGMHDVGCRVALDDFGTGYGAFTELRNLNLYALKIDQSFVRDLLEDRDDERVVRTLVFVAREYGLITVAEGVESEALLQALGELGVDRAQGFFFGKPAPIAR